ncbi:MAG: hypothetical protein ACERLM_04410 [Acidimicrobiales bacterium]
MLPEWMDAETLKHISAGALVLVVVAAFLVTRFVQKLVVKTIALVLLAALGLGIWFFRADLSDCWKTCNCQLLGREIAVPEDLKTCP